MGFAHIDVAATAKPRRIYEFLRHLEWKSWSWYVGGIDIDSDGGVEGTGLLIHIQLPRWLKVGRWPFIRDWMKTQAPPPDLSRQDISDILMASLVVSPNLMGIVEVAEEFSATHWAEDKL